MGSPLQPGLKLREPRCGGAVLGGGSRQWAMETGMNQKRLCQRSLPALAQQGLCPTCPVVGARADGDVEVLPHLPSARG